MMWFLVIVVLCCTGVFGAYLIYILERRGESLHNGGVMVEVKRFRCFYGLHAWYTDRAWFSSVTRCKLCDAVEDEDDLRRLEYERELWDKESELRHIGFDDSRQLVAIKLLEWDRRQSL